jgi:hypothetical protein
MDAQAASVTLTGISLGLGRIIAGMLAIAMEIQGGDPSPAHPRVRDWPRLAQLHSGEDVTVACATTGSFGVTLATSRDLWRDLWPPLATSGHLWRPLASPLATPADLWRDSGDLWRPLA